MNMDMDIDDSDASTERLIFSVEISALILPNVRYFLLNYSI